MFFENDLHCIIPLWPRTTTICRLRANKSVRSKSRGSNGLMRALKIQFHHNLVSLRKDNNDDGDNNNKGGARCLMKASTSDFGSGLSRRRTIRLLKKGPPPSYAIVTKENVRMALFIDGVKLSTLKRLGQCVFNQAALIHAHNSRGGRKWAGLNTFPYYSINARGQADKTRAVN